MTRSVKAASPEQIKRALDQKRAAVLSQLRLGKTLVQACRFCDLRMADVQRWTKEDDAFRAQVFASTFPKNDPTS